jgi:hypothetical protein
MSWRGMVSIELIGGTVVPKKPKQKMTDPELFDFAKENDRRQAKINARQAKLDKRKDKVIKELEARGVQALERDGYRINGTWSKETWIDEPGLLADLDKKQKAAIIVEKIDRKSLSRAVQSKLIPLKVLKRHSGTKPKKPYYRLTQPGKGKKK